MNFDRFARNRVVILACVLLLTILLPACGAGQKPTVVRPANIDSSGLSPSGERTRAGRERLLLPATWTPTPNRIKLRETSTPWPLSTIDARLTLIAGTTQAPGFGCKKHVDAWKVFVDTIWETGWCEVRGGWTSTYEYRMIYPEGWTVNTFGEKYPHMAFSIGQPNIDLRLYQVFSYDENARSYSGSLEEAPEKAVLCEAPDNCRVIANPDETFIAKEMRTIVNTDVMIQDSEYGDQYIRRYYMYIPFNNGVRAEDRLFVLELTAAEPYIDGENYKELSTKIDRMIGTLRQR